MGAVILILAGIIAIILWMTLDKKIDTRNPVNFNKLFDFIWVILVIAIIVAIVLLVIFV